MRSRKTGSPTVRKALGLADFRKEVMRGFDRAAGRLKQFEEPLRHGEGRRQKESDV